MATAIVGIKFHTALAQSRASKIAFRAIAQTWFQHNIRKRSWTHTQHSTHSIEPINVQAKRVRQRRNVDAWKRKETVKFSAVRFPFELWWKKNGRRTWARTLTLPLLGVFRYKSTAYLNSCSFESNVSRKFQLITRVNLFFHSIWIRSFFSKFSLSTDLFFAQAQQKTWHEFVLNDKIKLFRPFLSNESISSSDFD